MNKIILITGGARSGKSYFSEKLAEKLYSVNNNITAYIATSEIVDEEFEKRINIHRQRRSKNFDTIEECINIRKAIKNNLSKYNIFLTECITTWLGNIFYKYEGENIEEYVLKEIQDILNFIKPDKKNKNDELNILYMKPVNFDNLINELKNTDKLFIFVTNEIGLGIVPDNSMSRNFRDILGRINQKISSHADYVFFCISGNALRIK